MNNSYTKAIKISNFLTIDFNIDIEFNNADSTSSDITPVNIYSKNNCIFIESTIGTKSKPVQVKKACISFEYNYSADDKIFMNGYQSWTDSYEHSINDKMRGLHFIPHFLVNKYSFNAYGDYDFTDYPNQTGSLHGYTYAYIRNGVEYFFIGSLNERISYTIIRTDVKEKTISISKDCDCLDVQSGDKLFELFIMNSTKERVYDGYFSEIQRHTGINCLCADNITGYTSWYDHYENINEELITRQIDAYGQKGSYDVFQIDDGYELNVGDWLNIDQLKFPNGMKALAKKIKSYNMKPGIWLAPFAAKYDSILAKEHPDWLLKNPDNSYVSGGNNWGGFYILDFYNDDVRAYLRKVFNIYINEWGFEFLKLDFLYAVCLIPRPGKTRGRIMCEAMDFLRELCGNAQILGCGVPLGPAFGKVEYCRIGCDVSLSYNDVWWMRMFHRERPSTKNSIANTIGRAPLDHRAFLNDPDVYLLRDYNIKMSKKQRDYLYETNSKYGSVLFTSDEL